MDDDISGFVRPVSDYAANPSTFTLIHSSAEGFCDLYRGERAGRINIYKCLKPQWRGVPLQEAILRKEFELCYPLKHPGISETYQYTCIDGLGNCIEMEWVDGETLDEFLKHGRPEEKEFKRMAAQLCDAISYIHSKQVLHRDLKPSNIMVTHAGHNVKLIDFGLADSSASAVLKAPAGTRNYMAPEVQAGGKSDIRSDIWSLGKVLGLMSLRHKAVVRKCTMSDPEKRYQSVAEVRDALSVRPIWPFIAAVAVLAAALVLLLPPRKRQPERGDVKPSPDTVVVLLQPERDTILLPAKESKKPSVPKDEDLDRIFREASELLEEKL
jgi:serine/threonine protein kinase